MSTHEELARRRAQLSAEKQSLLKQRLQKQVPSVDQAADDPASQLPPLVPEPDRLYEPFALTELQEAYWVGQSDFFALGNVYGHMYVEIGGVGIDIPRGIYALNRMIQRHPMLRAIVLPDGRQQILEQVPYYYPPIYDLRGLAMADVDAQIGVIRRLMTEQGPATDRWPLLEVRVHRYDGEQVRLHFSLSLLICDGWSFVIFGKEFWHFYHHPDAQFEPLMLSFRDYVGVLHAIPQTPAYQRAYAYWAQRLATLPPAPALPLAANPDVIVTPHLTCRRAQIPKVVWQQIQRRAAQVGLTANALLCATYAEVLTTWSQSPHYTLNLVLAHRLPVHAQVYQIMGNCTTTLLLEVDHRVGVSFTERARRLQAQLWADQDHYLVSGITVIREQARAQGWSAQVSMPVVFASTLGVASGAAEEAPSLTEEYFGSVQTPQIYLEYQVSEDLATGALNLNWESIDALFPEGVLDAMFAAYQQLLLMLAGDDVAWQTPMLTLVPADDLAVRAACNAAACAPVPEDLLHVDILAFAREFPERPAVIAADRTLSYAELTRYARALAGVLYRSGARPNRLVAVVLDKGWEQPVATLAVLLAGAAYLPIDPSIPAARRAFLLAHAQVELVLTSPVLDATLDWVSGVTRLVIGPDVPVSVGDSLVPAQEPTDLAYVIYTSGSTGLPKGVMISHRAARNTIVDLNRRFAIQPVDRVLALSALTFDLSVYDIFGVLAAGGTVVLPSPDRARDPVHWAELVQAHGVTLWNSVPALADLLLDALMAEPAWRLPSLRLVFLSGDWIPVSLPDRLRQRLGELTVISMGGATEAAIWSIMYPIGVVDPAWRSIPYGRPMVNQPWHVLDERLQPRPTWVPGELFIGGVGVAEGYWGDVEKTAERFIVHPQSGERLYRTGDLGRYVPDGTIEFLGRVDFQVKIRGFRIELGEVEVTLRQHPAVRDCVAIVREDRPGDRRLVAYVVGGDEEAAGGAGGFSVGGLVPEDLRAFLLERLPDYMVPAAVVVVAAFPLSPNGKVDRAALPAPEQGRAADMLVVAPRTLTEELVALVWSEVLGVAVVGREDNFFALGGHSLLATQVIVRIREAFSVELPLRVLFEAPTLVEFAGQIDRVRSDRAGFGAPPLRPLPRPAVLPLSFAQQRLWFLDQFEPNQLTYTIPGAMRLRGRLDLMALSASVDLLIQRHETLRTTFAVWEEQPIQVIASAARYPLTIIDMQGIAMVGQGVIDRVGMEVVCRPFDLVHGPLLRVVVMRLAAIEHVLLLTMHHSIADGWSMEVLVRDVTTWYAALTAGAEVQVPPLPIQYADYALWQRAWLQGDVLAAKLEYWRAHLIAPTVLELPTDYPRPPQPTFAGALSPVVIGSALRSGLMALSRQEGVTLFMTLLAAFQVVLARYSNQDDILIGSPIAGRTQRELEGLIGFFVNTLVLRGDLSGNPSFRMLLRRTRTVCLDAYTHQDVPFERLVEEVLPTRDVSRHPLFQVMFILQNLPAAHVALPDLTLVPIPVAFAAAKFDLTLMLSEVGDELVGHWEYATDLFDAATMVRLTGHFQTLLAGVVAHPDRQLADLSLLTDVEVQQLLVDWNATEVVYPQDVSLNGLFLAQVAQRPDSLAVVDAEHHVTFAALNEYSGQVAQYLQSVGVGSETFVGVCFTRSAVLLIGLLGVLKAGGVFVPIDPLYPRERLALMLADARVSVLLTMTTLLVGGGEWVGGGNAGLLFQTVCLDVVWSLLRGMPVGSGVDDAAGDRAVYVVYTSGSMGRPKGVVGLQGGLRNRLFWMWQTVPFAADEVCCQKTSLNFVDSLWEVFGPLLHGVPLVVIPDVVVVDPPQLVVQLARQRVTRIVVVPTLLQALVETCAQVGESLPLLTHWTSSGEVLPIDVARRFHAQHPGAQLLNLYGSSEVAADALWYESACERLQYTLPIGRPIANVQVYVLDRYFQPVEVGVVGEVFVGGAGVARGYVHGPDVTAERFVPNPFVARGEGHDVHALGVVASSRLYRTGDLARYRPDGNIEFVGRADQQVKVHGYRIELAEVEAALRSYALVVDAVVLAREDGSGERRLVGYIVLEAGAAEVVLAGHASGVVLGGESVVLQELRAALRVRLPEYMLPAVVVVLAELPRLPNGKIDRGALPAPDATAMTQVARYVAPRNPVEEELARIWASALNRTQIGVHDDFFALGGHSLMAARVMARTREAFQVDVPLRVLFENPTIGMLGDVVFQRLHLQDERADRVPTLPQIVPDVGQRNAPFPLTEMQEAYWIGQADFFALGNIRAHFYVEFDVLGLDRTRSVRALNRLIARHDALRLVMLPDGRQQILESVPLYQLPAYDLRDLTPEDRDAQLAALRHAFVEHGPTTDAWPLFDMGTSLLDNDRVRLHFSMSLLICDGWSFEVFGQEFWQLYHHPETELEVLEVSFRDYVLATHALQDTPAYQRAHAYWGARLATLPPAPQLPLLASPTSIRRSQFVRRKGRLSAEEWQVLQQRATQAGVTATALLCTAYAEVLTMWSQTAHYTLNLLLSNRLPLHPQVYQVMGNSTSTLLLEVDHREALPFLERVRRLQAQLWADLDQSLVSGVTVVREQARLHGWNAQVAMPVVFASMLNVTRERDPLAPVLTREFFSSMQTPQVFLDHQVTEDSETGALHFNWDTVEELFPAGVLDAMFAAYQQVLQVLTHDEASWQASTLPLVPTADLAVRAQWNAAAVAPVPTDLLHTAVLAHARRAPAHLAVVAADRSLSYAELVQRAHALALLLVAQGARPNTLVAIVLDKGWEQPVATLAVLLAGAAYLPIDPALPAVRRAFLLEHAHVQVVLTSPALDGSLDWSPDVRRIVVAADMPPPCADPLPHAQQPTDLAYVIYTSGSTGVPKGVMISHRAARNTIADLNARFAIQPADRVLALSALTFDLSVYDIFGVLAAGGTVVMPAPDRVRDPLHWADLVEQYRITLWNSVPALAVLLLDAIAGAPERDLASVRLMFLSGDWIPVSLPDRLRQRLAHVTLISMGGATEAAIWSIIYPIGAVDATWRSIPYGTPMHNQPWHVLDHQLQPRPTWVPGELYIGGVGVAEGYWEDEEKTAERFITHPQSGARLYRTGDLGRYLPDGTIEFLGRVDFQVKIQGYRIELGEIEATLRQHPEVLEVVALAREDRPGEKRLVAYVIAAAGMQPNQRDLRMFVQGKLPEYMVPAAFVVLEHLPLSPNGKIDRQALPAPEVAGSTTHQAMVAPRTPLEWELVQVWQAVLGHATIGVEDDFFELGGTSLVAVRLMGQVAHHFGTRLPLASLFEAATVAQQAELLHAQGHTITTPLVPLQPHGTGSVLFCIHPVGGNVLCYIELARALGSTQRLYGVQAILPPAEERAAECLERVAARYITAIQAIQPHGPYWLCGWSMGGTIAYEMADQLVAQGESIACVAIIDAAAQSAPAPLPSEALLVAQFARQLGLVGNIRAEEEELETLLQDVLMQAQETGRFPDMGGVAELRELYDLFVRNMRLLTAYTPRPAHIPVVLFRASQEWAHTTDATLGWGALARGGIKTFTLPGTHDTLLTPPTVQALADHLKPHLT